MSPLYLTAEPRRQSLIRYPLIGGVFSKLGSRALCACPGGGLFYLGVG